MDKAEARYCSSGNGRVQEWAKSKALPDCRIEKNRLNYSKGNIQPQAKKPLGLRWKHRRFACYRRVSHSAIVAGADMMHCVEAPVLALADRIQKEFAFLGLSGYIVP